MMNDVERLRAEVKKLGKRANQRLVRLEQMDAETPGYNIARARIAERLHAPKYPGEKPRFHYNKSMTERELQKELKEIKGFLKEPSSTYRGFVEEYNTSTSEELKKHLPGLSNRQTVKLFKAVNTRRFRQVSELIGSDFVFDAMKEMAENDAYIYEMNDVLRQAFYVADTPEDMDDLISTYFATRKER